MNIEDLDRIKKIEKYAADMECSEEELVDQLFRAGKDSVKKRSKVGLDYLLGMWEKYRVSKGEE